MQNQTPAEPNSENSQEETVPEQMLLILAQKERSIRSTASFLTRRGVPTKYIANLNEAIEAFTAKKANMLLLSVNFPHPKIEMIPALILQSFNIEVIAFAEDSDRKSTQKLQTVKTRHVIQGPVSGPTVLMRIRQIEKDLADNEGATADGTSRSVARSGEQDQSINVRGGSSTQANQEALASLMSAASEKLLGSESEIAGRRSFGGDNSETSSRSLQSSGETYVQKGSRGKSHLLTPQQALRAAIESGLEEAGSKKSKLIVPLPEEMRRSRVQFQKKAKYQRKHHDSESHQAIEMSASSRVAVAQGLQTSRRKTPESKEEELFLECLTKAFETVAGKPDDSKIDLSHFRKAMLVSVRSAKLKGSFLIGVGKSKIEPQTLMERLQVAFFSRLRTQGIELNIAEQFAIEIDQTVIAWGAFALSNHILISETSDMSIGVAVVSVDDPVPNFEPYERGMVQVPLADIPANEPVTFNVFLHLKRNNRFLRYIRTGSKISNKQVSRLERFKITHVLVDGKEQEAYSRHYAAHSIQPSKRKRSA